MVKKKKKTHRFWNTFGLSLCLLLLIVGIALVFHKSIYSFLTGQESNHYQIAKVSRKKIKGNESADATYDSSSVEFTSIQSVLKVQANSANLLVIGGIAAPDVGINLPVFRGLGDTELSYGAGTMRENQAMGGENNYVLVSHHVFGLVGSSKMLFSPLENAKMEMKTHLTDKSTIHTYVTIEIESCFLYVSPSLRDNDSDEC